MFDGKEPIRTSVTPSYRYGRQFIEELSGLDWPTPDYTTLCRRQQHLQVCISYRANPKGLHLLMDSTGVKMLGEREWKTKKHGSEYRRQWRKVHLGIDADTLEIWAIEVTSNRVGDAQVLPDLLNQIPRDERIDSVSAVGLMIPSGVTPRLPNGMQKLLFLCARMGNPGKKTRLALTSEMKHCGL